MKNMLMEKVDYKIDETPGGVWRRFVYPNGQYFAEYRSRKTILGMPLVHYTRGKCPETGRRIVARGFIAVGRMAVGVIALGHVSAGIIAFGQASLGLLLSVAQAGAGFMALGQLALGIHLGIGQLASGATAIGQFAVGKYILAQIGFGEHMWTADIADPAAVDHFRELWARIASHLPFTGR
ncbi:MAG: hypothetical protein JW793_10335 [Acidobacteria bacterium]|nr:hypothetical protein [Acidobacteriota bacterium]